MKLALQSYLVGFLVMACLSAKSSAASESMDASDLFDISLEALMDIDVMIATGTPIPLSRAPSVATVITAEEIKAMGATSVYEVLESVPGLHLQPTLIMTQPKVVIRGLQIGEGERVLMLRNGIPIKGATSSAYPNGYRAPVANISRIEVVRGPGSAVHGADAFAGVINIITKNSEQLAASHAGVRVGSFDTQEGWLQQGGEYAGWRVGFSLEYMRTDGDQSRIIERDLQSRLDTNTGTAASLAPGPLEMRAQYLEGALMLQRDNWHIDLWHWDINDAGHGAGGAQALDPVGHEDHRFSQLNIQHDALARHPDWGVTTRMHYTHQNFQRWFQLFPPGAKVSIGTDGNLFSTPAAGDVVFSDGVHGNPGWKENKYTLSSSALYSGIEGQVWRFDVGGSIQDFSANATQNFGTGVIDGSVTPVNGVLTDLTGTPYNYVPDLQREHWYSLVQNEWALNRDLHLTTGVRYDHYSDVGGTTNPRAALVWMTTSQLTTKFLYGRAFRAPAIKELFFINNPVLLGSTDVSPEIIDTAEIVFDYQVSPSLHSGLNLFFYDMDDTLAFIKDSGASTRTAKNNEGQQGRGLEAEVRWRVGDALYLRSNIALQYSRFKASGEDVADAPQRQFHLGAHWRFNHHWSVNGQFNWVDGRPRASSDLRAEVPSYGLLDMTIRHATDNSRWEFALLAKNLLDKVAFEPSDGRVPGDYPVISRSLYGEVRYVR